MFIEEEIKKLPLKPSPGYIEYRSEEYIQNAIENVLERIQHGESIVYACEQEELPAFLFYRWMTKNDDNKQIMEDLINFRGMMVEETLYMKALRGDGGLVKYWLNNRSPGRWRDKVDIDHGGQADNPLIHKIERVIIEPTLDNLKDASCE